MQNAFEPSIRAAAGARPEDGETAAPELVAQTCDEWSLRANHDEVGVDGLREPDQPLGIVSAHGVAVRQSRDPRVPRRTVQPGQPRAREMRQASACSRAPEPISKTSTLRV